MKTTTNININGISFTLDEDAYQLLNEYMISLKAHFKNKKGGAEIISDIEARIAELFQNMLNETKQVINLEDVKKVKSQLGQPSDFEPESEEEQTYDYTYDFTRKRLYRDINDRMIGGVCSGLGAYFHVDTTWVRLAFVIAIISGVSPFIYLILWIVIPPAISATERLEMRGAAVNISNIEKAIKEELSEIRDKVDDLAGKARDKFRRKRK